VFEKDLEVPQREPVDYVHTAVKTAIASIPNWWAAPAAELFSLVFASPIEKRRDEVLEDVVWVIRETAARVDGLQPEKLAQNEAFISATMQAARIAMSTHKQEKREALRNALLNIALHHSSDEDQQQTFLRYIDELTIWGLRILALFQDPTRVLATKGIQVNSYMGSVGGAAQILEGMYPELNGHREVYDQIITDLHARGLLNASSSFLHAMMTGNGMVAKRTTPLADTFLAFIEDPLA
jgi:hypothetical protein